MGRLAQLLAVPPQQQVRGDEPVEVVLPLRSCRLADGPVRRSVVPILFAVAEAQEDPQTVRVEREDPFAAREELDLLGARSADRREPLERLRGLLGPAVERAVEVGVDDLERDPRALADLFDAVGGEDPGAGDRRQLRARRREDRLRGRADAPPQGLPGRGALCVVGQVGDVFAQDQLEGPGDVRRLRKSAVLAIAAVATSLIAS